MAPQDLTTLRPTAVVARERLSDRPMTPTSSSAFVGVVGLGHMGAAFALNLIADGRRVMAYDRDPAHVEALRGAGAEGAGALADLAACDFVLTSLPDDEALISDALDPEGLLPIMRPGAVHISMSTISPGLSRRLTRAHEARHQGYVAAPVLGNPDLARARHLFVLAAGKPAALEQARPLLESLGQRLFVVGEDASAGNLMKLAGNVLTAATLQSMGEVLALLRKGGIDQQVAFDILTNSLFDSKVHRTYGSKIVEERYSPAGMAVPLALKDLRLALAEAEHEAVPMPVASLVRDRLVALVAGGWAEFDWSALGGLAARDAGLAGLFDAGCAVEHVSGEV
jgi:3-hydroxyisobutyrate dehydrogenase-like beta-hydroxyacid dehydrogenase